MEKSWKGREGSWLWRKKQWQWIFKLIKKKKKRRKKKCDSDLWSYFSIRKENKNIKRFWILAITMKNICWRLCKYKFILPWAWLLIKMQFLSSTKLFQLHNLKSEKLKPVALLCFCKAEMSKLYSIHYLMVVQNAGWSHSSGSFTLFLILA